MPTFNYFVQTYGWPAVVALIILLIWSVIWKGIALWKAAKNEDLGWFVVMLVVNTVGILEILYIYVFSKKKLL
ncbi:MAG: DUF5652 family protein [Candidatus Azambacteria bacterium]|nr:DUF5652 family protein [Candidatus Azambacteria bacterium]